MRVVIDANVFVSAAIQRGASHRIIESWLAGTADLEVVMCSQLLGEVRDVLTTRPRLRKLISLETSVLVVDTIEALVDLDHDPAEVHTETMHGGWTLSVRLEWYTRERWSTAAPPRCAVGHRSRTRLGMRRVARNATRKVLAAACRRLGEGCQPEPTA